MKKQKCREPRPCNLGCRGRGPHIERAPVKAIRAAGGRHALRRFPGLLLLACVPLGSCATTSPLVSMQPAAARAVLAPRRILVLPPVVRYERLQDERVLQMEDFGGDTVRNMLRDQALLSLQRSGFADVVSEVPGEGSDQKADLLAIEDASERLVGLAPSPDQRARLAALAASDDSLAVLIHFMRVKVGPGGSWNPLSGAITSGMSSSHLRAALVSCKSGEALWKGAVFLRAVPDPKSGAFAEALQRLYAELPQVEEP